MPIDPELVEQALADAGLADRMVGIVLRPRLEVAFERNRTRTTKSFDTAILEKAMTEIDADLARDGDRPGWHEIDNSDEEVDATVDRIWSIGR